MNPLNRSSVRLTLLVVFSLSPCALPQKPATPQARPSSSSPPSRNLAPFYDRWLNQDVVWIITDEELAAFKKLSTNAEADGFIQQFWKRRDPTPDTEENEYKEEHYRRIFYANQRFAAGVPGWRTDRGRIYIMYGKPDAIESHPMGGPDRPSHEQGGGQTTTYPFEVWKYRYLEGIGQDVEIKFVDQCACGEYRLTSDGPEGDPQFHVPKTSFDRLQNFARLNRAPEVKFKDLEAVVDSKIQYKLLPLDVRIDFAKATVDTDLVPVSLQVANRDLTFVAKDRVSRAKINVYGRLSTLTGKIVTTFEESEQLEVPEELLSKVIDNVALFQKTLLLSPGHYRLDIALKDVNGDKLGTFGQGVEVPQFDEKTLASSTLIVADVLESVPSREVGAGSFVLGTQKVRPRLGIAGKLPTFKRDQKVNFWMQVYNLAMDEKSRRASATVEYQVINTTSGKPVVDVTEDTSQMGPLADQLTLAKSLPASKLDADSYRVTIKITDLISQQTISSSATFAVE